MSPTESPTPSTPSESAPQLPPVSSSGPSGPAAFCAAVCLILLCEIFKSFGFNGLRLIEPRRMSFGTSCGRLLSDIIPVIMLDNRSGLKSRCSERMNTLRVESDCNSLSCNELFISHSKHSVNRPVLRAPSAARSVSLAGAAARQRPFDP